MITEDALLSELETVTHAERVRRMVVLGQEARTDPDAASLLLALAARSDFYPCHLALLSCFGSKDSRLVVRALSDESRILRGVAVRLVPLTCTDTQAADALDGATRSQRMALLRGLLRHRRRDAIDMYLHRLAVQDEERLGRLLSYGSAAVVEQYAARFAEAWGGQDWARLARLHPEVAVRLLRERVTVQTEADPRLLMQANNALPELTETHPDDALELVRDLLRYESPTRLRLGKLSRRRPNEIADLLLAHESGESATVELAQVVRRLAPEQLTALLQHRPRLLGSSYVWLRHLAPDLRRAAYGIAKESWRDSDGIMATGILAYLPQDVREPEARRQLALPILATRPSKRLLYATYLPWDEARALLDPMVRNPDPELRIVALHALIGVARYHPERLPDVLALVKARANEQDPVRRAMIRALAGLPPSRWSSERLSDLQTILQDALNAADLSPGTGSDAQLLLAKLVPFHPEWGAPWLGKWVQAQGRVPLWGWENRLTDADVRRVAPFLMPVFAAWESREREQFLVAAASALGRRLRVLPELVALLENVVRNTRQNATAANTLFLLRKHRPDRLAVLVPQLLESDPSTVVLAVVFEYLHRKRQDLLNPYLGRQSYSGRFSTGRTRFVLPLFHGFQRWTPTQQQIFADTLQEFIADEQRDLPALFQVVRQLAAIPSVDQAFLLALASEEETRAGVRDATLRELAHLDAGQGVPVLLEAMEDSRARVAIYALRAALMEMSADQALMLLWQVPTDKVTVAKEVVRLIGDLNTPAAFATLIEMSGRTMHRDVRVALLRALWSHLEEEQTWNVLNAAATDPDPAVASSVIRIPADRISVQAQRNMLGLIALLLTHPDVQVRIDTLNRAVELPLADTERIVLPRLRELLGSQFPDEHTTAARTLFATYAGNTVQDASTIGETIGRVRGDRRVLTATLDALHAVLGTDRARLRPTVRAVLAALASDPLTAQQRVCLAIAGLNWEENAPYLQQLAQIGELHVEALMAAVAAIEVSAARDGAAEGLQLVESALFTDSSDALRRLALAALVGQTRTPSGWTQERRERLEAYCGDTSPLVAAAAQFTFPPP